MGAQEGTLSIMVAARSRLRAGETLFDAMARPSTHVGPPCAGHVVKGVKKIVVALVIEAVSEALVLGSRVGVAPEEILDILGGGPVGNIVVEVKRVKFLSGHFEPGGKVEYHRKDLGIALVAGREYGVSLPATTIVDQMFGILVAQGRGGWDHSALVTLVGLVTPDTVTASGEPAQGAMAARRRRACVSR